MKPILLTIALSLLATMTATLPATAQMLDDLTQAQCDAALQELNALPDTKTLKSRVYASLPLPETIPSHTGYREMSEKYTRSSLDYLPIFTLTSLKYNISMMRNLSREVKQINGLLGGAGLEELAQQFGVLLGADNPMTQVAKGSADVVNTGGDVAGKAGHESPAAKTFGIKYDLPKDRTPATLARHKQMEARMQKMAWRADSLQTEAAHSDVEKRLEKELQDRYAAAILARFTKMQIAAPSWEEEQEMEKIMAQIVRKQFFKDYVGPNAQGLRALKKAEAHWLKVYLPFMEEYYTLDGKVKGYDPDHYLRDIYAHAYVNLCNNRQFVLQHTLLAITGKK